LTLKALAPLGDDYVQTLRRGFESRWVDWLPAPGKRSGAYSQTTYGVHPYQLQNFTGLYDELSTLAHESGHSMHSHLADKTQPYVTHDYATFVAEVASTLNENLLFRYMLDRAKDDDVKLSILGTRLELLRGTLFRQALFAEFEASIHQLADRGETLTGENLSALFLRLLREYYGHAEGVCQVDDLYAVEWAYIPHFFWNFYVYQYATSITASTAIVDRMRQESQASPPSTRARDSYLRMLAAGGAKYPIELLKDAGVNMTTSAPFNAAMKDMNDVMDQMESILAHRR
jgi:oligoendopeptidase F